MDVKGYMIALGLGAAAGAVAVLAMPRNNPARQLAAQAADQMEGAVRRVSDLLSNELDF